MNVRVNATCGNDLPFTGNSFGTGTDRDINIRLDIRVARFANAGDKTIFNANVSFYYAPVIEDECIGNDSINDLIGTKLAFQLQ